VTIHIVTFSISDREDLLNYCCPFVDKDRHAAVLLVFGYLAAVRLDLSSTHMVKKPKFVISGLKFQMLINAIHFHLHLLEVPQFLATKIGRDEEQISCLKTALVRSRFIPCLKARDESASFCKHNH
jgi:mannose/fructose-specific phosphotransferase system component IIA